MFFARPVNDSLLNFLVVEIVYMPNSTSGQAQNESDSATLGGSGSGSPIQGIFFYINYFLFNILKIISPKKYF
jgi:hypothetical protein